MATAALDTRSRILDAALALFSEHGVDGTTLQQIADRLGVTKAALYYHFHSKADILEALVGPAADELDALLDRYEDRTDGRAQRRRFVEDYVDCLLGHRRLIAWLAQDIASIAHPVIAEGASERHARIQQRLGGENPDFGEQVRIAMAIGGIGRVIAGYPDAAAVELRAALLDALRALLRGRPHRVSASDP